MLWKLIFLFMFPGVGDGDEYDDSVFDDTGDEQDQDTGDDDTGDEQDQDTGDDDTGDEQDQDTGGSKVSRAQSRIQTLNARAKAAEEAKLKVERDMLVLRTEIEALKRPRQESEEERVFKQEQAILDDPNADVNLKYQIQGMRTARGAEQRAKQTEQRTQELLDKLEFKQMRTQFPEWYDEIEPMVEDAIVKARAAGNVPPRAVLFDFFLGKLTREKKLKSPTPKKKGVNRGKPLGVKSDVTSSGKGQTNIQKIEKRLENYIL